MAHTYSAASNKIDSKPADRYSRNLTSIYIYDLIHEMSPKTDKTDKTDI